MNKPIVSFAVIIISLLFAFFYVVPLYRESVEHNQAIRSLDETLKKSDKINTLISNTKESLKSIEGDKKASFEVFLPETIDPVRFANDVQYLGKKNRVVLSDIKVEGDSNDSVIKIADKNTNAEDGLGKILSIGEKNSQAGSSGQASKNIALASKTDKKYFTTSASFTFSATYEVFKLFLNDLERSLEIMEVKSLSFSPGSSASADGAPVKGNKEPSQPVYQIAMTIETYSLK